MPCPLIAILTAHYSIITMQCCSAVACGAEKVLVIGFTCSTGTPPACRLARAKALRSFMKDRSGDLKPATFFYHFMNLCKGIQKLNPPISRDESEKAYERGCARTVGCATGETFEMLTALPRDTMCAYGILPHGCRSLCCPFSTGIVVVNVAVSELERKRTVLGGCGTIFQTWTASF